MTDLFEAGHSATPREMGLQQLQRFAAEAGERYAQYRNTDYGPTATPAVSQLSPFIRHRLITEVEVLQTVLAEHGPVNAEKFVQEVFWRTYFKGYLEHQPAIWSRYRQRLARLTMDLADQSPLAARYQRALRGQTGIPAFDAWALELQTENYLHNHARMWFASIWIFSLELPWELGADYFMQHLLDGDPASNTLSWRWVAGLHTKGKHYLARSENIARYSNGRFPNTPGLNEDAVPILEPPLESSGADASLPLAHATASKESDYTLLLHEEDLHWPELVANAASVAVLGPVEGRSASQCAESVIAFVDDACRSTAHSSTMDGKAARVLKTDRGQSLPESIARWARQQTSTRIVVPYPPVGPVRDAMVASNALLSTDDISIEVAQRDYDRIAWPHCKKGFFQLRKRIPELLATLA